MGIRCERSRIGLFGKTATKESIRLSTSTNALLANIRTFGDKFFNPPLGFLYRTSASVVYSMLSLSLSLSLSLCVGQLPD